MLMRGRMVTLAQSGLMLVALVKVSNSFQPSLPCRTFRDQHAALVVKRRSFVSCLDAKKKKGSKPKSQAGQTMAVNRVAYSNYEIIEKIEAGISLKGTEGKETELALVMAVLALLTFRSQKYS